MCVCVGGVLREFMGRSGEGEGRERRNKDANLFSSKRVFVFISFFSFSLSVRMWGKKNEGKKNELLL